MKQDALYIPSLDGIRAAAVMIVFLAHAGLNEWIPGNFGVTVFFFLSGYLITTLLRIEAEKTGSISLRAFYLRRVLRIMPPMYTVLAVAAGLTLLGVLRLESGLNYEALLAQMFHLTNYYIIEAGWWAGWAPGTWIFWSLAIEEHFYLLFPLAYIVLRRLLPGGRRQLLVILGFCALVLVWRFVLVVGFDAIKERTYIATDTRIDSILFGCALAVFGNPWLDRTRISERWWKSALLPLGGLAILASFVVRNHEYQETVRYTLQGLGLFPFFVVAVRYPDWLPCQLLNIGWVKFVGLLSYSLYLVHPSVLWGVGQWIGWETPMLAQGLIALVICVALAVAIHYAIERPCAQLRKRLSRTGPVAVRTEADMQRIGGEQMKVSVVMCTRNRPDLIGGALESVLASEYPDFDVVVVDQSDDDATGEVVRSIGERYPGQLRYVYTSTPGLSRAYNIGIRSTDGELLAFTDDDCIAPPEWISAIVASFAVEPEADMLYGQVLRPKALANQSGTLPILAIDAPRRLSHADGFRIYGMGANFAVRRRLFERIGGFDEVLGGGGPLKSSQDFDFQYRAFVAGAVTLLRPEVKVDHYGIRTGDQWPATLRAYGIGDGAFYSKHVRCGDLFALRLLAVRLTRMAIRETLLALGIRRRGSQRLYLGGVLEGIRAGLRYPVDREHRLYGLGNTLAKGSIS